MAEFLSRQVQPPSRVFLEGTLYHYLYRTDILTASQSATERQRASEGCAACSAVIRDGGFDWLTLGAGSGACPIPDGFSTVFRSGPITVYRAERARDGSQAPVGAP